VREVDRQPFIFKNPCRNPEINTPLLCVLFSREKTQGNFRAPMQDFSK